jgi:hypothetical protein
MGPEPNSKIEDNDSELRALSFFDPIKEATLFKVL